MLRKLKESSFPWAGSKLGSWRRDTAVGMEGRLRVKLCLQHKDIWGSLLLSKLCIRTGVQVLWRKRKSVSCHQSIFRNSQFYWLYSCLVGSCWVQPWSKPSLILWFLFSLNLTLRCNSVTADTLQPVCVLPATSTWSIFLLSALMYQMSAEEIDGGPFSEAWNMICAFCKELEFRLE